MLVPDLEVGGRGSVKGLIRSSHLQVSGILVVSPYVSMGIEASCLLFFLFEMLVKYRHR